MEEQERAKIEQERQKAEEKIKLVEEDISFHQENVANAQEGQQMAQQMAESKSIDKKEELCKISSALAVLASASVSDFVTLITSLCFFSWHSSCKGNTNRDSIHALVRWQ